MNNWQNNPYLMQLLAQQQTPQVQNGMLSSALQPTVLNQHIPNPYTVDRMPITTLPVLGQQQGNFTPFGTVNRGNMPGFSRFPDYQQNGWGNNIQNKMKDFDKNKQPSLIGNPNLNPNIINPIRQPLGQPVMLPNTGIFPRFIK